MKYKKIKVVFLLTAVIILQGCSQRVQKKAETAPEENEKTAEPYAARSEKKYRREKIRMEFFYDFGSQPSREANALLNELKRVYGKKVEIRYHAFPLYPESALAAEATECARDQEKFQVFYESVFADYFGNLSQSNMIQLAQNLQLNMEEFTPCLTAHIKKETLGKHKNLAEKYNVQMPPFLVVEDHQFAEMLPEKTLKNLVRELLTAETE
jgi:protein-disulfide isomerase